MEDQHPETQPTKLSGTTFEDVCDTAKRLGIPIEVVKQPGFSEHSSGIKYFRDSIVEIPNGSQDDLQRALENTYNAGGLGPVAFYARAMYDCDTIDASKFDGPVCFNLGQLVERVKVQLQI
ncbi:MAG: hypothetical protein KJ709_05950 [Nanoarchaeota archaeon]|nr:hypothetical protein [Nanoarchaeota archaeon]